MEKEQIYIGLIGKHIMLKPMDKQKAIKAMAKRLEYEGVNKFECYTIAKWCLDELLKGVKKWK